MVYISSFKISQEKVKNPNIYPYNVFSNKEDMVIIFDRITILYGNNGSGKSTILNIIANAIDIKGAERTENIYFERFLSECRFALGEDENGRNLMNIPENSRYIKSEDILYEIKKIRQEVILREGYVYEHARQGYTKEQLEELKQSKKMFKQIEIMKYAQERYSNGETTLQVLMDYLVPDALFLLDEPEVSLSPQNQVFLADELNKMARLLNCQFIISTHSPFMLGTLNGKIYNLDSRQLTICRWSELENIKYFYGFFKEHEQEFI